MKYSINLTIHNKGFLIGRVLNALKEQTTGDYEIVIVLDGCSDDSEYIVDRFFLENKNIAHKILYADDVFETKANNIAAKNSSGDCVIIVQDDVVVGEMGWNERLAIPLKTFSEVFAVTARTAYNYRFNTNSEHIKLPESIDLQIDSCWSDILYHESVADNSRGLPREIFAVRNCVNRGPLLIDHGVLEAVNYLDEAYAPQDQDDADLCYRVFKRFGKVAGCYPTHFISDLSWGGSRPDGSNQAPWSLKAHHKNTRLLYTRHQDIIHSINIDQDIIIK